MASDDRPRPLVTSPARRMLKLGGLLGRVGASVAGTRALVLVRSGPAAEARRLENLLENASRIVQTLGEMKGAAMKVGQMLSLHATLLPPEVGEILQQLQAEAPRVPPEVMRYEVEGSLGKPIDELFAEFEEEAFAAASIGQVHRARLPDGRPVAVKVQYPLIREVVTADLDNLKTLLRSLFALVFDADFEPLWKELSARLLEELDYEHEAANMKRMRELHASVEGVEIPGVVDDLSTSRVLTMEFREGISPSKACSDRYPEELRDRWGTVLFEFQMRGLFEHRLLHADPNLANFSFLEDGGILVYDFGCLKRIPDSLAENYARMLVAELAGDIEKIPELLAAIGLAKADGSPLERELIEPYIDLFLEIMRESPPYRFGEDPDLYQRIMELGASNWTKATDLRFPDQVIFVNRSLAGHLGNLIRLRAAGPWRKMVERYARAAL